MANFKHISIDGTSYDAVPAGSYVTGVKGSTESTYRTGNVNITKSNIGLGNVPNVTTNNQAPTFTQASTRANIASGETLTVILGKIMKFFADLKTVAFSGSYTDLSDKPTIPTVNNATLTIQKNGTNVQTFTANASSNKTANITVPTKTSELTNDSGFITDAGVTGVKGNSETTYRTGNVNITKGNIGLGNVPNVTTNNQAPTFTQASTRANIASGETLTTIFGKIMKWFADLKTVAFTGSYTDLSDKPTIPTVNNATLTIQKNGTNVQTFTANQSTNATANITVPTVNNTLTSTSTTQALSANQGRALNVSHNALVTDLANGTNKPLYAKSIWDGNTDADSYGTYIYRSLNVTLMATNPNNGGLYLYDDAGLGVRNKGNTAWVPVYASNFVNSSSKTVKHDIKEIDNISSKLYQLRPVSFIYNDDKSNKTQFGLIAEDVKKLYPEVVIDMPDNQIGIDYTKLIPIMIKEIQNLKDLIDRR